MKQNRALAAVSKINELLRIASNAVAERRPLRPLLAHFPAAIYVTDSRGVVIHYNPACISFAGRIPRVGHDLWCVTWRLYTEEGEFLPHDQCPMAIAIRERRPVRDLRAVAERPDGTHVGFRPHPTPVLNSEGEMLGAINLLMDLYGAQEAQALRVRAMRSRLLVNLMPDEHVIAGLTARAAELSRKARDLEAP